MVQLMIDRGADFNKLNEEQIVELNQYHINFFDAINWCCLRKRLPSWLPYLVSRLGY